MSNELIRSVVVIVAHPDDETLWAGGTILSHPLWNWYIICLCRKTDKERANKFYKVLNVLNAKGIMGDLDDGPDQMPLGETAIELAILNLLPARHFNLIITHNPNGEYTRHKRHEEVSKAVITLWQNGKIVADELQTFAYEDGNNQYFPLAIKTAPLYQILPEEIWQKKYNLITKEFGFSKDSWEAKTTPKQEAFWTFSDAHEAKRWLNKIADS
jgi:LmbE family N-acetylglucosaminyl deacetylase